MCISCNYSIAFLGTEKLQTGTVNSITNVTTSTGASKGSISISTVSVNMTRGSNGTFIDVFRNI